MLRKMSFILLFLNSCLILGNAAQGASSPPFGKRLIDKIVPERKESPALGLDLDHEVVPGVTGKRLIDKIVPERKESPALGLDLHQEIVPGVTGGPDAGRKARVLDAFDATGVQPQLLPARGRVHQNPAKPKGIPFSAGKRIKGGRVPR